MPAYPTIDRLEIEERTGKGVAIIVEGQTYEDDAWFYQRWFDDQAQRVTFFPQDGWPQVVAAVEMLRAGRSGVPVYGIIDRDFCSDEALDADFAARGILRTPRFTLENYLLDPECWARVFAFRPSPQGRVLGGWDDPATVRSYVETAFKSCLPPAAHNWVIHLGQTRYGSTTERAPGYWEDPDQPLPWDPAERLHAWGRQIGAEEDFGLLFERKHRELESGDMTTLQKHVSGKYVICSLHRRFPTPRHGKLRRSEYLYNYIQVCPDPPADLVALVDRILQDAGR